MVSVKFKRIRINDSVNHKYSWFTTSQALSKEWTYSSTVPKTINFRKAKLVGTEDGINYTKKSQSKRFRFVPGKKVGGESDWEW